jgi:hypothetical protein
MLDLSAIPPNIRKANPMNTNRSPFTTAELMQLPRNAYAFRNRHGVWGIRQDAQTAEQVVATGNNQPLRPSDYYLAPVDSVVIASRQAVATQAERAYESANYWN